MNPGYPPAATWSLQQAVTSARARLIREETQRLRSSLYQKGVLAKHPQRMLGNFLPQVCNSNTENKYPELSDCEDEIYFANYRFVNLT
jgi:hypothetical protein